MIERIQSLYLLLCGLLNLIVYFYMDYDFLIDELNSFPYFISEFLPVVLSLLISMVCFYSIFKYKIRKNQFVINRINVIICFVFFGLLMYNNKSIMSHQWIYFIPLISVLLLVFSNRAIKKDEELIKSLDRIR